MITPQQVRTILQTAIENTKLFIVDVTVKPGNKIMVLADSPKGISIDQCVQLSRAVEGNFDREVEDFELEVSSPGLLEPFKVIEQYSKNINRQVEVVLKEGDKHYGLLLSVGTDSFVVETKEKVKPEGKKKLELVVSQLVIVFDEVKTTKLILNI